MSDHRPAIEVVITHLALGGAENVALSIVDALCDAFAFEVFVILKEQRDCAIGKQMAARLDRLGVPVRFGTGRRFKHGGVVEAAWALRHRLTERQPALVHVHTEIPELTLAMATILPGAAHRVPVLRTIHNVELWPQWSKVGSWVQRRLADASIAGVSASALKAGDEALARAGLPTLPSARRALIYNGVRELPQKQQSANNGVAQILFAGRFEPQKGADLLVPILKRAAALSRVTAEVTLMGTGSLEGRIKAELAGADLRWPVRIVEALPNLAEQIDSFDLVLMPSRFEGLGLVAAEALLAGVPVIATRAPGLVEVVPSDDPLSADVDDVEGLAQRLSFALLDLNEERRRVAKRLPSLRERFGIAQMRDRYDELYRVAIAVE